MQENTFKFLDELEKCSYTSQEQTTENFRYNQITYAQGVESYNIFLQSLFTKYKAEVIDFTEKQIQATKNELLQIRDEWCDIPNEDTLNQLEAEYQEYHSASLKISIEQIKFVMEMRQCQLQYVDKALNFLKPFLNEDEEVEQTEQTEQKGQAEQDDINRKEWLSLDEVVERFGLSKSTIKDRQWRKKHGFPEGNDGSYGKLIFSASKVEEWMENRK
jgi:predicted DNA-binding transcriptional regulator AlpA